MTTTPVINTNRLRLRPHAQSVLDVVWAFCQSSHTRFMAQLENLRSVALANRLGAILDHTAKKYHPKNVVYRYAVAT
ncbi:hypothetical protein ROLI_036630 [Roseobacter fucihabitans]|uniref:Uncharacterized protein n=1 Tax=Roseobacter fucihabitans TaxID=1537242 RepID=A0ABZ2BYP9_9RHOB|nr:hypothetical protein [Roseobacter litoralis]